MGADGQATVRVMTTSAAGAATEDKARPVPLRFLGLVAQIVLLAVVIQRYRIEEPVFLLLCALVFGGFLIHYWLPFRFKEVFAITLSLGGAFLLLSPITAALLIASGLALFGVIRSALPYRFKVATYVLVMAGGMYAFARGGSTVSDQFWPVFGSVFMFRMAIYLHDLRHMHKPAGLRDYLSYFFILPNYYFLLFPVIDFQTLRRSYYRRDIHEVAQEGIVWMGRGVVQLLLYRLVYHNKPAAIPERIDSLSSLLALMVFTYLLYLRVSGQFHIIAGMLKLFGYDLPETHRKYLLAHSLTDFWRRINIYWKDFMVKMVYFPIYFKMRKKGDLAAQVGATSGVFAATWALHSLQFFWVRGEFLLTWPDTIFWSVLGILVIVNLWFETKFPERKARVKWQANLRQSAAILATFSFIVVLWSLWHSSSVTAWLNLMTWWRTDV